MDKLYFRTSPLQLDLIDKQSCSPKNGFKILAFCSFTLLLSATTFAFSTPPPTSSTNSIKGRNGSNFRRHNVSNNIAWHDAKINFSLNLKFDDNDAPRMMFQHFLLNDHLEVISIKALRSVLFFHLKIGRLFLIVICCYNC